MKDSIVLNSKGWYWPKHDGGGNNEAPGSCWYGLNKAHLVPENVSKFVEQKNIVVQAGGNCGFYIKKYADLFKLVYTFEPDPINFYCLNLNVTEPNVLKFQAALGREHKGVSMGNFLADVGATHVAGDGVIPTMRVDDLALVGCDLLHLDIEGYELHALQGAEETIKKYHPVIALEFYKDWAARYNTSLIDIENYLKTLGYEFFEDVPMGKEYEDEYPNGGNDKIYKFKVATELPKPIPQKKMKVYDCFPFFKEFDILEVRLEEMWDVTDYFVIVEATTTHSGLPKPLYLKNNFERFKKYASKIRHIVVEDLPREPDPWIAERFQRDCISRGLYDMQVEDLVIVSDCDEIPRAEAITAIMNDPNDYDHYVLAHPLFYYRFNFMKMKPASDSRQPNIRVIRGRAAPALGSVDRVRTGIAAGNFEVGYHDAKTCVIEHAGWHFTYFGDTEFAISKIKSFAHYRETDQPQYMDNISVETMIKNKCALCGPDGPEGFEYVKIDDYFPKYIVDNPEKFKDMIIPGATHSVYDFYKP